MLNDLVYQNILSHNFKKFAKTKVAKQSHI